MGDMVIVRDVVLDALDPISPETIASALDGVPQGTVWVWYDSMGWQIISKDPATIKQEDEVRLNGTITPWGDTSHIDIAKFKEYPSANSFYMSKIFLQNLVWSMIDMELGTARRALVAELRKRGRQELAERLELIDLS